MRPKEHYFLSLTGKEIGVGTTKSLLGILTSSTLSCDTHSLFNVKKNSFKVIIVAIHGEHEKGSFVESVLSVYLRTASQNQTQTVFLTKQASFPTEPSP